MSPAEAASEEDNQASTSPPPGAGATQFGANGSREKRQENDEGTPDLFNQGCWMWTPLVAAVQCIFTRSRGLYYIRLTPA
jgi:hypothetical protein